MNPESPWDAVADTVEFTVQLDVEPFATLVPREDRCSCVVDVFAAGRAHSTAQAQGTQAPGVEVRFMSGPGKPGSPRGTLVANFSGQWMPVTLDTARVPDPNVLVPR